MKIFIIKKIASGKAPVEYRVKVSDTDAWLFRTHVYRVGDTKGRLYVYRNFRCEDVTLSSDILGPIVLPARKQAMHINGDTLDYRRSNLHVSGQTTSAAARST